MDSIQLDQSEDILEETQNIGAILARELLFEDNSFCVMMNDYEELPLIKEPECF
jgi:hypothetical protein